jgi:hypothetical protein
MPTQNYDYSFYSDLREKTPIIKSKVDNILLKISYPFFN